MLADVRYAARLLVSKPGFALTAILTLSLGIGATTAIFSLANAILWRSIPFADAGRLVMVLERRVEQQQGWIPVSPGNFVDWKRESRSFERFAAYEYSSANLTSAAGYPGDPERLQAVLVSPDFFATLGAKPALGRTFTQEESEPGRDRVAILSHGYWTRRFAANPSLVGESVEIDGRRVIVAGVMPAQFDFPPSTEIWMPLALPAAVWQLRPAPQMFTVARLKPGVTQAQAAAEMDGIARRLEQQFPETNRGWRNAVISVHDFLLGGLLSRYTWMLIGVVGLVLLIACANVANLQFARATGRTREMAVRIALGASRWRIVRQLLSESLALSLAGAFFGLLVATWGVDLLRTGLSADFVADIPNWNFIRMDSRAFIFTLAIAVASGVISGLAPALQSSRRGIRHLPDALKEGGRSASAGRSRLHLRNVFATSNLALAVVLLVGAGLMSKGLVRLIDREQSLQPGTLLTMRINLLKTKYGESRRQADFYSRLLARVRTLPGVMSAAVANAIPHSGTNAAIRSFQREGAVPPVSGEQNLCEFESVSPSYLRTLRIPLYRGRDFTGADNENSPPVAIVSDRMARRVWPGADPVGRRVRLGDHYGYGPWLTIVGVAADVVHNSFDREPRFSVYVPMAQAPMPDMHLLVRTAGGAHNLIAPVESEVHRLDREQPVYQVATLRELMRDQVQGLQYLAILMSIFGGFALILASVGVYGVMAYSVSERTQEIGVRMALGAASSDVMRLVLRSALSITAAGVAAGLAAAFALARVLASVIFGVSAGDPATFGAVAIVLASVAIAASYIPARRAMRVEPTAALRQQ
ncbi:MAG TPA: ABC transporter permease [Bryobacteraceae bacterium]|nr:ABC transporter permease [Bryobacteraceae bacterium]